MAAAYAGKSHPARGCPQNAQQVALTWPFDPVTEPEIPVGLTVQWSNLRTGVTNGHHLGITK
jgi:hypothetical protein